VNDDRRSDVQAGPASRRILTIVHQEHSATGRVGELLIARGFALDRCCPSLGEPLPGSLEGHDGVVIFGGPMSANDEHLDGIRSELAWLPTALESGRPVVGICLGAQLIARALGARVGPRPDGLVEMGYYEVRPSRAGRSYFDGPTVFYQWHSESFELPRGSVHLAESDNCCNQAFRYDHQVFGLEFHPEMTRAMVDRWSSSSDGAPKLSRPGAQPREAHLEGYERYAAGSDRWLARFLDHLLPSPGGT
jgi:GMP synthase (glutamine-hydrolysing)